MALITTGPTVGPAVTVDDAMPFASVTPGVVAVAEPDATWNVTDAPCTGRLCASVTRTVIGWANGCPITADWLAPLLMTRLVALRLVVRAKVALPVPACARTCNAPGI